MSYITGQSVALNALSIKCLHDAPSINSKHRLESLQVLFFKPLNYPARNQPLSVSLWCACSNHCIPLSKT